MNFLTPLCRETISDRIDEQLENQSQNLVGATKPNCENYQNRSANPQPPQRPQGVGDGEKTMSFHLENFIFFKSPVSKMATFH